MMSTYTHTEPIPSREGEGFSRSSSERRRFSIHRRHVPSCRIRGFGL